MIREWSFSNPKRRLDMLLLAALMAGSLSACASLPAKKRATEKLAAVAQLLGAARDAERALCSPAADKTKPVAHCDAAPAVAAGLTDARQQAMEQALTAAFDAQSKAAVPIEAWKAGDPPPAALQDLIVKLEAALLAVQELTSNPSIAMIADSLQQAIGAVAGTQAALTAGT